DGSARPFVAALKGAGIRSAGGTARWLEVREKIRVIDGESVYEVYPAAQLTVDVTVEFPHPLIGRQQGSWTVTPELFEHELGPARTFGFMREVEGLREKGLIKGATTSNTIVLDENGLVECELRFADEFVRHKAMD